jgi:uncharacterized protein YjiS (DUF1127 family)
MTTLPLTLPFTLRRGLASLLRPVKRSAAIAELSALDERLLRDIGLSRVDVDAMRRMW